MALGPLVFRVHAIQRMFERGIGVEDVRRVLEEGETIERYPDDAPLPSRLVLGHSRSRAIHVVAADDLRAGKTFVITVYEPASDQWESDLRTRKRP